MIHIENMEHFKTVISEGVTLVDFYANWCGPCRMLSPFVEEIDEEYKDRAKIVKVDVDECGDVASQYNINAIPALLIFKNNELINTNIGFIPKEDMKKLLDEALSE